MVLITEPSDLIIKPKVLTSKFVCYWAEKEGILIGDQQTKAEKFLENNCIERTEKGFICKPIEGYNKTTYKIEDGKCSCQYNKKYNKRCSHLLSVGLFNFIQNWNLK